MAESLTGSDATQAPQGSQDAPAGSDEAWRVLDTLTEPERRFVNAAIGGKDWPDCAEAGGWTTVESVARVLGRPRVRAAIETLAPLIGALDPKRATKLLRPYMLAKLTETAFHASEAQSTQAIKELVAIDGIASKGDKAAASLMDILASVERRISARTVTAEVVKMPELPASAADRESRQAIGIASIPGEASDGAAPADAADGPAKRRGRRARRGQPPE